MNNEQEVRHQKALKREKRVTAKAKKTDKVVTGSTGIKATEILKAPVKPPEVQDTDPPEDRQIGLMAIGLGIALLGVIVVLVWSFQLGALITIVGGIVIATGTLIRI